MKTAVVTGATGTIGAALCRRLLSEGVRVYAVCRRGSERMGSIPDGAEIVECNIDELDRLKDITGSADVFYHLAWKCTSAAVRNDMYAQADNIRCTLDAVRAAKELGCECFIGAGSQAEYGRHSSPLTADTPCFPESGYGMAKLCAGQMSRAVCREYGIRHIWTRILSVYGPYNGDDAMIISVMRELLDGKKPSVTEGGQMWDYLYSADAAEAMYLMWKSGKDGAVYPLGSGSCRPLREYLEILRRETGEDSVIGYGERPYSDKQVMYLCADISQLREDTGFEPKTSFAEGIRLTADWLRERNGK